MLNVSESVGRICLLLRLVEVFSNRRCPALYGSDRNIGRNYSRKYGARILVSFFCCSSGCRALQRNLGRVRRLCPWRRPSWFAQPVPARPTSPMFFVAIQVYCHSAILCVLAWPTNMTCSSMDAKSISMVPHSNRSSILYRSMSRLP